MEFTLTFIKSFFLFSSLVAPLIVFLLFLIVIFGQCATYIEKWSKTNGLYWSFITATTVGYGDIRPVKKLSKCCAVIIAILGLIVGGIVVSIALEATSFSIKKHLDPQTREMLKKELG